MSDNPLPSPYALDPPERAAALARSTVTDSRPVDLPPIIFTVSLPTPETPPAPPKPCTRIKDMNCNEIMARWPRMVAHIICESLGYYSPDSAAYALRDMTTGRPAYSEWFMDMASKTIVRLEAGGTSEFIEAPVVWDPDDGRARHSVERAYYERLMVAIGRHTLERAYHFRSHHKGFMADYWRARAVIAHKLTPAGADDISIRLSSWQ